MSPSKRNQEDFRKDFCMALENTQQTVFDKDPTKPILIKMKFIFRRPKSHFWFSQSSRKLILDPVAPTFVTKVPDLDNLVKLVLDSLQGVCFTTDANVASITAEKAWDQSSTTHDEAKNFMGLTLLEVTQIDEAKFDPNCNCTSCNTKKTANIF